MKRAAIYDPYLDTAGGGERYMLQIAKALNNSGFDIDIVWKNSMIGEWLQQRTGIDVSKFKFTDNISKGLGYDVVVWLSDGSIPLLFSKNVIIHFQTPFKNVNGGALLNKLKFSTVNNIICNSNFTKKVVDKEYGIVSKVIYPPIKTDFFKSGKKENIILYVGRYSRLQQQKRQDVLIDVFKKVSKKLRGWKLVVIGGSEIGGEKYVTSLKNKAKGYPISILENLSQTEVAEFYSKAKIFWSASGYGVDESLQPEKVEHFGMSIAEAMSAGVVPIVTQKGGHTEIIKDQTDGFFWNTKDELANLTLKLARNERGRQNIAKKAIENSKKFGESRFNQEILSLFK